MHIVKSNHKGRSEVGWMIGTTAVLYEKCVQYADNGDFVP